MVKESVWSVYKWWKRVLGGLESGSVGRVDEWGGSVKECWECVCEWWERV